MSKWEIYTFDDVIIDETKNGTKIKKEDYLKLGLYPIIDQGQNQIAGYINTDNGLYKYSPAIIFGDHTRVIKYIDTPFFLGADGVKLLKSRKSNVSYKYLYYFFIKNEIPNTGYNRHFKWLKELEIPLPPLETQKQIAKTLDNAAELLAMRKQQLVELDNLINSTFYDMFGDLAFNDKQWITRELVEICKNDSDIKCGPFGTQLSKDEYQTSGVPLWGIPQINTFFKSPTKEFLTEKKAISLEAYSIIPNDITMSRKGIVGKCALYPVDFPTGIMHSDVLRIRVNQDIINPYFILHQLHLSGYIQNQIKLVSGGAIMAGVNVTKLKHIVVHVPPMALQNQFAAIVAKIEEQKTLVKKAIDETQHLFDRLMSEYFE